MLLFAATAPKSGVKLISSLGGEVVVTFVIPQAEWPLSGKSAYRTPTTGMTSNPE